MSRVLPILAILVVVWASPGAAVAAPSSTNSDVILFMQCSGLTTQDGRQIFTDVEVSQEFGAFAGMAIWASDAEPFLDEPIIVSVDATATLSGDGSTLTATYELWSFDPTQEPPFGELIGTAELNAEFTAIGEPIPIDEHFKEGNRLFRTTGTRQALAVAGELVIPDDEVPAGEAIDLSGCFAEIADFTSFSNAPAQDPASFSFRNEGLNLSCQWELDDGTFVDLFAFADEFGTGSGLFIQQGETSVFGFDDQATVSDTAFAASYELRDDETGEVAGAAEGSATLDATGERVHFMDRFRGDTFKTIGELLSVDGSLEIDLDGGISLAMDADSCSAIQGKSTEHIVDPRGPKPKPLANDTPEGALPLAIGESVTVLNGGTAFDPEADCVAGMDPDTGEVFLFPITNTAWWTFTGTGGDVTVSTAGSDFDTILAVYRLEGEELVQVACVDDTEEGLQAEATFSTEADTTYYIQAGGFAGDTGRLTVSIE